MPSRPGIAPGCQGRFAAALELQRAGRVAQAAEIYRELAAEGGALAADARINLAVLLDEEGRHREALALYREVLSLRREDPLALNNMGNSLMKLGEFREAAGCFRRALAEAPDCRQAGIALGAALQRDGDVAGAIACFRAALERDPADAEAHWNLALALLMDGQFREGWSEYRWRWLRESFTSPRRDFSEPLWDGSPFAGRRLLVHAEQGLGDTIQFMRYLPLVASRGGELLVECQSASLRPLLQRVPGVLSVSVMGEPLPPFDLQVPLLSLPYLFATELETIPARVPYLAPDPERLDAWRQRLPACDYGLKVGIVWGGKSLPDPFRSCTLEALAPLGAIAAVTLYSLQMGEHAAALGRVPGVEVIDLTAGIADFDDTAALISQLDLVISVDTSVAHLAGALGKPVWLLLPRAGDYRWLVEREDSPWYPTMRIFRQKRPGAWEGVVERLCAELKQTVWRHLEASAAAQPLHGWRVYHCGAFLAAEGRHREASARFTKAAQLLPGEWEPHYSLAASLQLMGRLAEARESLESALAIRTDLPLIHETLGIVRQMMGDLQGAEIAYRQALRLDAGLVKARFNLANALRDQGRFAEAKAGFAEVARLSPGHADARWNLAVLLLLNGEFTAGWREFAWRFQKSGIVPARKWQHYPRWDGSPLAGRGILLYAEQGLGDTLQFVRYAPLVAGRGGRVFVEVQSASLATLVSRVAGVSAVTVAGAEPPPFELQASLLELPEIFATGHGSIPAGIPYLHVDPLLTEGAKSLVPRDGSLRVGLVWSGNPGHTNDANRSLSLEKLAPLAGMAGVTFYSLQLKEGEREPELDSPLRLQSLSHSIRTFDDTAALAAELDLVITVDTSVAHLCGGLGVPVWVLLPFVPDWRWLLERDDSPWYPTMRLFRQRKAGDWEEVVLRVREALSSLSCCAALAAAEEHKQAGHTLSGQGRYLEAVREFEQALLFAPSDCELLNNLGCALDGAGRHGEAVSCYQRVISVDAEFMASHYNMGNSLKALGRAAEAIESYQRALSLDPRLPQGWHNLALALQDAGRRDEAREALERAIALQPDYLQALHNLGELQHADGDLAAAMDSFREVLARDPGYLPSWNALGIALQLQDRLEEALECYRKALSLNPDYLHALNNLGSVLKALGRPQQAEECYRRVLVLDPGYADAHWNLGLVQLLLGEYQEGWRGYEWRFRKVDPIPVRNFPQPLWDGGPLTGRVILLHTEQGFGDTIQFVRYAPLLARMGGVVLVECQSESIAPLISTVPGVARVLVRREPLPHFDLHAPLMSLPYLCGSTLGSIPAEIPYLCCDPAKGREWQGKLGGEGLKVGLVWAGRKSYQDDHKRSLGLGLFAPLAAIPGVRLYSLQVGEGAEQAASPPAGMELIDLAAGIGSFADTAAIIDNLDLVISADTAVAHLAGALGKPVWVLLPMACDWRWLLGRDDSPWYPSARLFRQSSRGDWVTVLERVAEELERVGVREAPDLREKVLEPRGVSAGVNELIEALRENRLERAGELCGELLWGAPDDVELLTLAGTVARQKGELGTALRCFSKAAAVNPGIPELHNNVGVILEELGRNQEAVCRYAEALALRPGYREANCNLGNTLRKLERPDEAITCYRAAIATDPCYPDAHYNLGNVLRAQGRWQEAVESYRRLVDLKPDHLCGWINLGGALLALHDFEGAIAAERRAIGVEPGNADAHWNLALALLAAGEFAQGWREYEWRLKSSPSSFPASFAGRSQWDGSPLAGRTLLLRAEQGFGDALQFFRYLPLLVRQGGKVVLECRPELLPLFAAQGPDLRCFAIGEEPPPFDTFAYLMSLPFLFGTTLANVPADIPYLRADAALCRYWGEKLGTGKALKVGVVWAGSSGFKNDHLRSLPLRVLEPLSRVPGIELYSLQLGAAAAALAGEAWGEAVRDVTAGVRSFADTAAIIAHLDLVVSVDTAVAHLAGAMGKPVYMMLPAASEWRWLHPRSDTPWYPGMRLYRQPAAGAWEQVVTAIVRDLSPQPAEANLLFREANALRSQGRHGEAVTLYRQLLARRPDCAEIYNNLGLALQDLGELQEAAENYRQALAVNPGLADAHNNLGTLFVCQGERDAAVSCFREAIALRDDYLPALVNLGSCLQYLERPAEALPLYRRAIDLQPDAPEARINLGNAYQELMQPERAIEVFEEALSLQPLHPELHWNLALSLLSVGDFERGWREYEWRFGAPDSHPLPRRWDGEAGGGKSLLLECEQGLGDTLQFVRYAPLASARGWRVLLQCQHPSLKPLLGRLPGVVATFARGEQLPPVDCQAPLLSLPRIFGTSLESVPATAYLSADPERAALWRSRMKSRGTFQVGLVWRGGPLPRNRACPFAEFALLSELAEVTFFSLQLGELPDARVLETIDLSSGIRDFGDSAAIIANLDLVITVDTATAHLAGGMGAPVWLLLPYACDWRWLSGKSDSPWYPSMRLFRQERPGGWKGVMLHVRQALGDLSKKAL